MDRLHPGKGRPEFLTPIKRWLPENEEPTEINEELLSVEAASRSSVGQRIAFGERRGQRVRRLGFRRDGDSMEFKGPQCMALSGFGLHAARVVNREDRRVLSQLINYKARPPIAEARLWRNDTGDIEYGLKEAWNDGTTGITLSPSELIEKMIALIPPRSSPLVRHGGVFATNFKGRDKVILCAGKRKRNVSRAMAACGEKPKKTKAGAGSWARLLRRVFSVDVSR